MSVVVLGSANLDLVYEVERIPAPGETVLSRGFASFPGGKGLNQAVAASHAGAEVRFIAALGRDAAGDRLAGVIEQARITLVDRRVDTPTGTAVIFVDRHGENSIVVDSGANAELVALTEDERDALDDDVLVLQLETPLETVVEAARTARNASTSVILNAAPSRELPSDLLRNLHVLVVNEHEAAALAGLPAGTTEDELLKALSNLEPTVIITLGPRGAIADNHYEPPVKIPGFAVDAVDTTGAGDTFVGAFATAFMQGGRADDADSLAEAIGFANAAAAIAVQRKGAVPSIPTWQEVEAFRAGH
jgi:ribokinase